MFLNEKSIPFHRSSCKKVSISARWQQMKTPLQGTLTILLLTLCSRAAPTRDLQLKAAPA